MKRYNTRSQTRTAAVQSEQQEQPAHAPKNKRRSTVGPAKRQPHEPLSEAERQQAFLIVLDNMHDNSLDMYQAATKLSVAGAFGKDWADILREFWKETALNLAPQGDYIQGPFKTVSELKAAANIGNYKVSGTKTKAELLAVIPQLIPPIVVAHGKELLKSYVTARDIEELIDDNEDPELDKRMTASRAMHEYLLTDGELQQLPVHYAPNPHYRRGPAMRLYHIKDIMRAAYIKHGGASGLAAAQRASQHRKEAIQENHESRVADRKVKLNAKLRALGLQELDFDQYRLPSYVSSHIATGRPSLDNVIAQMQRRETLKAALAQRGLEIRSDSTLCNDYLENGGGQGRLQFIVDTMDEMRFYFNHTDYPDIYEEVWDEERSYSGWADREEVSETAKDIAWKRCVERKGREAVLAIADLPPTLRSRLERSNKGQGSKKTGQQQQQQQVQQPQE